MGYKNIRNFPRKKFLDFYAWILILGSDFEVVLDSSRFVAEKNRKLKIMATAKLFVLCANARNQ